MYCRYVLSRQAALTGVNNVSNISIGEQKLSSSWQGNDILVLHEAQIETKHCCKPFGCSDMVHNGTVMKSFAGLL